MDKRRLALPLLLLAIASLSDGLVCYSCVYTNGDQSRACVDDPDAVTSGSPTVSCKSTQKYCTLQRQEIISTGEVQSFYRNCEDDPAVKDDVMEDSTFRTYFRSCQESLCNGGDGLTSLGGGDVNRDPNASGSLVVPGIGRANRSVSALAGFLVAAIALAASLIA